MLAAWVIEPPLEDSEDEEPFEDEEPPLEEEEEELEDLPDAQKEHDPLRRAVVDRLVDGTRFPGVVEDIERGRVTRTRLYRIRYIDGDLEHLTASQVELSRVAEEGDCAGERAGLPDGSKTPQSGGGRGTTSLQHLAPEVILGLVQFLGFPHMSKIRALSTSLSAALQQPKARLREVFPESICIVGGRRPAVLGTHGENLCSAEFYDSAHDQWRALPVMKSRRCWPGVCNAGGAVYACGGYVCGRFGPREHTSVERLDALAQQWVPAPRMSHPQSETGAVALGNHIYICGGGLDLVTDQVQRYDLSRSAWELMPPLRQPRCAGTLMTYQGRLYMCGGWNEQDGGERGPLDVVECFNSERNRWEDAWRLINPLQGAAMAAHGDQLYVCGGDPEVLEDEADGDPIGPATARFERYAFIDGAREVLPSMQRPRYGASAAFANGLLYVCGGIHNGTIFRSVEQFDPVRLSWQFVAPMLRPRLRPGVAVTRMVCEANPFKQVQRRPAYFSEYSSSDQGEDDDWDSGDTESMHRE